MSVDLNRYIRWRKNDAGTANIVKAVTTLYLAPAPVAVPDGVDSVELPLLLELAAALVENELPPTPVELKQASAPKGFAFLEKVMSAH